MNTLTGNGRFGPNTLTGYDHIGTAALHTNGLYAGWRRRARAQGYDCSLATCPLGDDPLTTGQTDEVRFDSFNTECDATFHNDEGDNSIGNNVLDPTLCTVDKKHTFAWVEISPLQMNHCIGATPEEQAACGAAPPRTGITTADVGTLIGFNDWTSGGRNNWAADDGWCALLRA